MPKDFHRREDEEVTPRRGVPFVNALIGAAAALVLGGVLGGLIVYAVVAVPAIRQAEQAAAAEMEARQQAVAARDAAVGRGGQKKLISRQEFRTLLVGKTPQQVLEAVGRPDSTSDAGGGDPTWYYNRRTLDPVSGKTDLSARVNFGNGVVVGVDY